MSIPNVDATLTAFHALVRKYHRTLDLVSDAALSRFPELIEQARLYAEAVDRVGRPGRILDVGSGVGLPGIVLAAALPHRTVLLVERRRRRATFLRIAVAQLALANAVVSEVDVRDIGPAAPVDPGPMNGSRDAVVDAASPGFSVVTAQAVATLADLYCMTRHLHTERVTMVARKGPLWRAEAGVLGDRIGAAPAVVAEISLPHSGTLVAIDVSGGLPCPRSG